MQDFTWKLTGSVTSTPNLPFRSFTTNYSCSSHNSARYREFIKFAAHPTQINKLFSHFRNLYTVQNQSVSTLMPADPLASTEDQKIFDIQQKFGAPSIELEGAIRYLLNSVDSPHEILISFGIRDVDGINKKILDDIKDALNGILRKSQPNNKVAA